MFLVEYIVVGVLALFFLFYFNRLFATFISTLVTLYSWHAYRIWIEIEALQISLLAGRIFFKGIRYHGDNETILVHGGYITWRYWLRSVKAAEIFRQHEAEKHECGLASPVQDIDAREESTESKDRKRLKDVDTNTLPCRISVRVSGVEAFLYNRSPAYDLIVDLASKDKAPNKFAEAQVELTKQSEKHGYQDLAADPDTAPSSVAHEMASDIARRKFSLTQDSVTSPTVERANTVDATIGSDSSIRVSDPCPPPLSFLRLFPIYVECNTGAAVLGNENTKAIITAKFDSAKGEFDASRASSVLDLFKILINFEVMHPYVQMKPNVDFVQPQLAEAASLKAQGCADGDKRTSGASNTHSEERQHFSSKHSSKSINGFWKRSLPFRRRSSFGSIAAKSGSWTSKTRYSGFTADLPGRDRWLGLTRYLADDQIDEHDEWDAVEYAKSSVLADIRSVVLKFYWDIPGLVPQATTKKMQSEANDELNGSAPPDYGLELAVRGGQINYGPWADRHRVVLQQIFFPAPFFDAVAAPKLKVGETRISTTFNLKLTIDADTVLRVPFREPSKDWKWKGRAATMIDKGRRRVMKKQKGKPKKHARKRDIGNVSHDLRPFAWFDIRVNSQSSVSYCMDMVPDKKGYKNRLDVDVSGINIYSSLNHGLLWRSGKVGMKCDLSNILVWNRIREWLFEISIKDLDLFLLRDHTFMMVDLIQDWTAGPLPDFHTFIPFTYLMNVNFDTFKLFLNTNDANIVDTPDDLDDNNFIILYGDKLHAELVIPLERFQPSESDISFKADAFDLGFEMSMPARNTLHTLLRNKDVAQLRSVHLNGTYTACTDVAPGLTETLNLDIVGKGLNIAFYGFLARQLAIIKENYFGDDVHFRTLEEYKNKSDEIQPQMTNTPSLKSNDLDVILNIGAEDLNILLPTGMYDVDEHVRIKVNAADIDLRVTNYYLEMNVNSNPLVLDFTTRVVNDNHASSFEASERQLFIDGVRVFGHRLFGLPPAEPAYVSNWDIDAGIITGECSTQFIEHLLGAVQGILLTINDNENALPIPPSIIWHDSTFVRFRTESIKIWLRIANEALMLSIKKINGTFNDLARTLFSQQLNMLVQELRIACAGNELAYDRHQSGCRLLDTHAFVQTTMSVTMFQRKLNFSGEKKLQQDHMIRHDVRAGRARFLLNQQRLRTHSLGQTLAQAPGPVSIPLPNLPKPVTSASRYRTRKNVVEKSENPVPSRKPVISRFNEGFQYGLLRRPSSPERSISTTPSDQGHSDANTNETTSVKSQSSNHTASNKAQNCHDRTSNFHGERPETQSASPFQLPHIVLNELEVDISDVPSFPTLEQQAQQQDGRSFADEASEIKDLEEDAVHTSVVITMPGGIVAYCKPKAVETVAKVLKSLSPKTPETILDGFQFSIVEEILSSQSRKTGDNSITDIAVRVPSMHLRFVHDFSQESSSRGSLSEALATDRYNLIGTNMALAIRLKIVPTRRDEEDATVFHGSLGSLRLIAREGGDDQRTEQHAAFTTSVDDILVYLVRSNRTSVHTTFNTLDVSVSSKQVDYLASLLYRTAMLAEDFRGLFETIPKQQELRLQYLVEQLVAHRADQPDPPFLTRPTHVLRSFTDHVRNSDSWKIISRLRYIYQCMSAESRSALAAQYQKSSLILVPNSQNNVLGVFDQWHSWEGIQIKESFAVRLLYGSSEDVEKMHDRSEVPISAMVRGSALLVSADPGKKQNGFSMDGLVVGVTTFPSAPPHGVSTFDKYKDIKSTVIQVNTSEISLHVNWEICELVDSVLTLFEESKPQVTPHEASNADQKGPLLVPERFHIVFGSDKASINLEAINIRAVFASQAMLATITGSGWDPAQFETEVNVLVTTASSTAHFASRNQTILSTKVVQSSVWVVYERSLEKKTVLETLKLVGSGAQLLLKLEEEVLGLAGIVQSVLNEEVRYIRKLTLDHPSTVPAVLQEQLEVKQEPMRINLALLLDGYTIELAILHKLQYKTFGKTLRLSMTPDTILGSAYQVDFDLKAQLHQLLHEAYDNNTQAANFDVPPINGSVRLLLTPALVTASAIVTMERVGLRGQAVYAALSMLSSEKVFAELEEIKSDGMAIMRDIENIFPSREVRPIPKDEIMPRTVIFDIGLSLAGFSILAETPESANDKKASLELYLSSTQIRVSNRSPLSDEALPFPEIKVDLGELGADLLQIRHNRTRLCGRAVLKALFTCVLSQSEGSKIQRDFKLSVVGPQVDIFAGTAPALVHVLSVMQLRMHNLDLTMEKKYIKKLRNTGSGAWPADSARQISTSSESSGNDEEESNFISTFVYDMSSTRIAYNVGEVVHGAKSRIADDLIMTLQSIHLLTRSGAEARLLIKNLRVAFKHKHDHGESREPNSALLPEIIINAGHKMIRKNRKFVIRAAGKALDIQIDRYIAVAITDMQRSIHGSSQEAHAAASTLMARRTASEAPTSKNMFGGIQVASLLLVADFAGAVVNLYGRSKEDLRKPALNVTHLDHAPSHAQYGQSTADSTTSATLRAPGFATKVQYDARDVEQANLNVEFRIDASENVLYPSVVPLILQLSDSVSEVMRDSEVETKKHINDEKPIPKSQGCKATSERAGEEDPLEIANPHAILGKTKLNFGFRICSQKFSLSCQPIAKVAATAKLEDIYVTINTVESPENGNFFAASITFTGLSADIQHTYSREPTFRFTNESIVLSLMNSKHISGTSGISAILQLNPTSTQINVKQFQDILLFREIWMPPEIRNASKVFSAGSTAASDPQEYFVQRYQQVAAAAAFPWNATLAIAQISIEVDLGQSIGKSSFMIKNFWASSTKSTSSQQTLCGGIEALGMNSTGRMSGFVELEGVKLRTSIAWPEAEAGIQKPLIQGSIGFDRLRVKAALDYQAFAMVDIVSFRFIMYNVRDQSKAGGDRLVAILDGDQVCAFCVATAPALAVSLFQSFERLIQEKQESYDEALRDTEKLLRRKSSAFPGRGRTKSTSTASVSGRKLDVDNNKHTKMPISLHTDVVVTLRSLRLGAFPSTLLDHQMLETEASNIEARFAVALENHKIHSGLGLTLGQLRVALAQVPRPSVPQKLGEADVDDVVRNAKAAHGGIILRVPRVALRMQAWQAPGSKLIDYLFRCSFEGKIDVGWNLSRISFIRGMWDAQARTLATRLGRKLPDAAVRISAGAGTRLDDKELGEGRPQYAGANVEETQGQQQQKITAVVNLPQSQNIYRALEPPVIDTPQLRDMGEATPPLEWIGLHRDRLPNVTHQIIITTLLEVAKEVEDAYSRVLGSA